MAKHRRFNADRFLDKFQGSEILLRNFVGLWDGRLELDREKLNVQSFKEFLINGDGDGMDEMLESLYRAYDLSTDKGHEDLVAACRDFRFNPDPDEVLPVECLSLKVRVENEDAFSLAYDRNKLRLAERFSIFRGMKAGSIENVPDAARMFQAKLAEVFMEDKKSDRVLVRQYQEESYINFIVYHEKRTKAELIFKGTRTRPKISPTILRPAQQDFISYDQKTGQVEIESRFEKDGTALRKCFAECCFGDTEYFDGKDAAKRIDLAKIVDDDFDMRVNKGHEAALVELRFKLKQLYGPSLVVSSQNVLDTLNINNLRKRIIENTISRAVFKITFPDDKRGKRVELSGVNTVRFKRATHAEEVFGYLRNWEVVIG